ncbi:MAG: hypothetical protein R3D62_19830 [Xanthobacteraceae bacterium]
MADEQGQEHDPRHVASLTLASLRRIENQLGKMMDVLSRHETRLGWIERDLAEVKSGIVLRENRMLTQTSEILAIVQRIDEHQIRFEESSPR